MELSGGQFDSGKIAMSPVGRKGVVSLWPVSCTLSRLFIAPRVNGTVKGERRRDLGGYESSSTLMSSELETTSFFDSDEDDSTSR